MIRTCTAILTSVTVAAILISLAPAEKSHCLIRTSHGSVAVAPCTATDLTEPTANTALSAAERTLRWRAFYSDYYAGQDREFSRPLEFAEPSLDRSSTIEPSIHPAAFSLTDASPSTEPATSDTSEYWQSIHTQALQHLQQLPQRRVTPTIQADKVLAMIPATPSVAYLMVSLCLATLAGIVRSWMHPVVDTFSIDSVATENVIRPSASCHVQPTLRLVLPGCWMTRPQQIYRFVGFDVVMATTLAVLMALLLSHAATNPWGWQRLAWWPLAELAALWG